MLLLLRLAAVASVTASMNTVHIEVSHQDNTRGCTHRNCSGNSLDHILGNLNSNDVLIKITKDVKLSTNILLTNLKGISLIGYNNPIVTCSNGGGLYLLSCHNITIEGITWDGCGGQSDNNTDINPVIQSHNSSNITIRNCSFQHSVGPTIVLSEVSGIINNCTFLRNAQYKCNGTAIHYSSNVELVFTINNCNFSYNGGDTIVYIGFSPQFLLLQNSVFHKNQGIPVYVSNKGVNINGFMVFEENVAMGGAGIYINYYSHIKFCKYSVISFTSNMANFGGAIFLRGYASVLFDEDSRITFSSNRAVSGGALHSENSYISFEKNSIINFIDNSATVDGGAILQINTTVIFNSCTVVFNKNSAREKGGALCAFTNSNVTIKGNLTAKCINNRAMNGAFLFKYNSVFITDENSNASFSNNTAESGGAIYITNDSGMLCKGNSMVAFNANKVSYDGGAVYAEQSSNIHFKIILG